MKKILPFLMMIACFCITLNSCDKDEDLKPITPTEPTDTIPTTDTDTIIPEDTIPDTTPQPTADFRYELGTSMTVTFSNTSTDATSYLWNFGDGSTSTDVSPLHAYATIGTKTVTLTAFNGNKSATKTASINMTSYIRMMSTSENPYTIYIDGDEVGSVNGGGSNTYPVTPGNHIVRVLQESGYVFYATDESYSVTCTAGSTVSVEFPEDSWGKGR